MNIITHQVNTFVNSDNKANADMMAAEIAVDDVIIFGSVDTQYGELVLDQDVIPKMLENEEAMAFVLARLIQGDMSAVKELRMLAKSAASEKLSQWANH